MDIMGGAGICMGDNNILASSYIQSPIGITVEGSNTLTRSLIIYGQGLMRSHPYLFNLVESISNDQQDVFFKNVRGLVWHSVKNTLIAVGPHDTGNDHKLELIRLSNAFSLSSNMMLLMGKKFKTSEMLSGRFADVFSNIYLSYSMLWYFEKYGNNDPEIKKLMEYMGEIMYDTQELFYDIAKNYPSSWGRRYRSSFISIRKKIQTCSDKLKKEISDMVTKPGPVFDLFKENIFIPDEKEQLGKMISAMEIINKNRLEDVDTITDLREEISQVNSFGKL